MKINQRKAGVIISYMSEGVQILSNLLYTPIMLRLLGQSEYGLYQLVYSVVSYLGLLSLSFGTSYFRVYSRYKKEEDYNNISRLNGMFLIVFSVVSVICLLCGIVMIQNVNAIFGNGLTTKEISKAKILMAFMVVNLVITFMTAVFNCITSAHEQFFFQKILILCQNILSPFVTLPLLILGYGSVSIVFVTTVLTFARLVVNIWFCMKKINAKFVFKGIQFGLLKETYTFTFFIFLNQIIDQINWEIDKVLLGRFAGTVAVAVYGLGSQLNSMYIQFSTAVSNVFIPRVNMIVAESDDNSELTKLFIKVGRIQFIVLALILSGIVFFGRPFIYYWGGPEYSGSYRVALCLLIPVTIPLVQNLGIEIQRAKNMHRTRSIVYFCISIGNVLLSIPLIKKYGITGAAVGTAVALVIGNVLFMNWYYHKKIGLDILSFWKSISGFIPALVPCVVIGTLMAILVSYNSLLKLITGIIIYTIIYCVSMWLFGMNKEEKGMVLSMLRTVRR